MKKIIYLGLIFSSSFLLSCWGTHTNTITIQTPFNPAPDLLVYHKLGSSAEDLTSNMGQPIVRTISYPETACIFSIFANSGTYNIDNIGTPAGGVGVPSTANSTNFTIQPQNSHPFQLAYIGSPSTIFSSGVMASTKKDMTIKYVNNAIYSWGNLPATGPFATATLPTPEIKTSFTIKDNLIDENEIYLYGFSQACALNFRFAFTNPNILKGVIGLCGGIPSDLSENEIYKKLNADVYYAYCDNDEFYTLEKYQGFDEKLKTIVPNYTSKLYQAKHEITDEMRNDAKVWLKEKSGK